jgi:hypothetical protein
LKNLAVNTMTARRLLLSILLAASLLGMAPSFGQTAAVMGQISAARYVLDRILIPAGWNGEFFVDSPLPLERYHEFQAVIFAEDQITGADPANRPAMWIPGENLHHLEEYLSKGGTVLLLNSNLPIPRDGSVKLGELKDLVGFAEFGRVEEWSGAVSVGEGGAGYFSAAYWGNEVQFPRPQDGHFSTPLTRSMQADFLLHLDGTNSGEPEENVLPVAGTLQPYGRGKLVWLRFSPMRLRHAGDRQEIDPLLPDAFDQAVVEILTAGQ